MANAQADVTKVLVAVHGIGEQTAYATVQAVANRVSAHRGRPFAPPLGRFYDSADPQTTDIEPRPQLMRSIDGTELENIVLAETYWAPIAREVVDKRFVLEDTKRWARSVAMRVAYGRGHSSWPRDKVERLIEVLDELIETVAILERLTSIADKAGVFKFDLARLLVDFVGDVQLVADFPLYRDRILKKFDDTVKASLAVVPAVKKAELYFVAHSEGTVITFLALLEALADPRSHDWIRSVRGLMTIGSPIEIHHLLWPGLWREPAKGLLQPSAEASQYRIPWHNYMDYGDPIAYELVETTAWLKKARFASHLTPVTHSFSRYPLPGKAHVDYWDDADVFGHFLDQVVNLDDAKRQAWNPRVTKSVNRLTGARGDVRSSLAMPSLTFFLPYALVALLLLAAVYTLEHAVAAALHFDVSLSTLARDVIGIGGLLFGITAAARLPRISDSSRWTAAGWVTLAVAMVLFSFATTLSTQRQIGGAVLQGWGLDFTRCLATGLPVSLGCESNGIGIVTLAIWAVALVIGTLSNASTAVAPRRGHYMLPALGLVAAMFIILQILEAERGIAASGAGARPAPSLWPLVLGSIAFFYLWWLGALLFDLVFVWRRYSRHAAIGTHLAKLAHSET